MTQLISFFFIFPPPRRASQVSSSAHIGRHYWWFAPLFETITAAILLLICLLLSRVLTGRSIYAVLFVGLYHGIHGLRYLDGFGDLSEGIFYKLVNPAAEEKKLWSIIRNPVKGIYGNAVLMLYLLIYSDLILMVMDNEVAIALTVLSLSTLFSRSSVMHAAARGNDFDPQSNFRAFSGELGKGGRLIYNILLVGVFCLGVSIPIFGVRNSLLLLGCLLGLSVSLGFLSRQIALRKIGHLNGDILGFTICISEVVNLLFLLTILGFVA